MVTKDLACPKCGEGMYPGHLQDLFHKSLLDEGGQQQEWVAQGGLRLPVRTYACESCGYLESYVTPPTPGEAP
jgi:predicted nucleic-acid-binding Zn-ribbon protein